MRWTLAVLLLFLAGCLHPASPPPAATPTYVPPPVYPVTLKVTRETAEGAPLPDAEAYLVPAAEASPDPNKLPPPRYTDDRGRLTAAFDRPTTLLVEVFGPGIKGGGWTREGMRLTVGGNVTTDRGLRVEDRTVTLPLLRSQLPFALNATWGPAMAGVAANGSVVPAEGRFEVPVPPAYAPRLGAAHLDLAWTQSASAFGDLYAGLARGGAVLKGQDSLSAKEPVPGSAEEASVDGSPAGTGPLQAVALTDTAVQGTLALHLSGMLRFGGDWPGELPLPTCFSMDACLHLPINPPTK